MTNCKQNKIKTQMQTNKRKFNRVSLQRTALCSFGRTGDLCEWNSSIFFLNEQQYQVRSSLYRFFK